MKKWSCGPVGYCSLQGPAVSDLRAYHNLKFKRQPMCNICEVVAQVAAETLPLFAVDSLSFLECFYEQSTSRLSKSPGLSRKLEEQRIALLSIVQQFWLEDFPA